MRTRLIAGLALLLALQAPAAPLRMGGFVVAPLLTGDAPGPLQGALRAFMELTVVRRAGVELVWTEPTSYGRALDNLKTGKIDVLLVTSTRYDNKTGAATFGWTYLRTRPHLAVRGDSPLQAVQSLQQLAGMEIGWVGGSPLVEGLELVPIHWQMLAVADWQTMNLRKLQAGRIQAVFFENEYSPQYYARQGKIDIRLLRLPMQERGFTIAYSLKANPEDIVRFDQAAAAAFANEQFKTFLEQYMKR